MANLRAVRRSGRIFRGGVTRRETLWANIPFQIVTADVGVATLMASLNAAALALRPFTIVRMRMAFGLHSDQAAAAEVQAVAVGQAVVSDQASAIGVTAVPTPVTDAGSDAWLLYTILFNNATNLTDLVVGQKYFEVDSRAMRKVEDGQDLVLVTEVAATSNGTVLNSSGRFLIKLH